MKKIVLYTLTILTLEIVSMSTSTGQCTTQIILNDQKSIDLFHVNYPGCTHIKGNVRVDGSEIRPITNLNGLSGIKVIEGSLTIRNTMVQDLTGLENIDSVYWDVEIENNRELVDLQKINDIKFIGHELTILLNPGIRILDTFPHLKHYESLTISSNDNLTDISSLSIVKSIGERLWINDNPRLTSLYGLHEIDTVGRALMIRYCDSLTSLQELSGLQYVGNRIEILRNNIIQDLSGLENIHGDSLHIIIQNNPKLESLIGIPQADNMQKLEIRSNHKLGSLEGLQELRTIEDDFIFEDNDLITDLSGLEGIEYINGDLQLTYNDNLSSIDQLQNLVSDSLSTLIIYSNPLLSSCSTDIICSALRTLDTPADIHDNSNGCNSFHEVVQNCGILDCVSHYVFRSQEEIDEFPSALPFCTALPGDIVIEETVPGTIQNLDSLIQLTAISGSLCIKHNTRLKDFSGLSHIEIVGKSLQVIENDSLVNFIGVESLVAIGDHLEISGNPNLISIQGLTSLSTIGGEFILSKNPEIQSLQSLSNLTHIDSNLTIAHNPKLQTFEGLANLQAVLGKISIYENDNLTSLSHLSGVNQIGGEVSIFKNNMLDSLGFLNGVDSIKGDIYIQNNPSLTQLAAFQNVVFIKGNTQIGDHLALKSLSGFQNLEGLEGYLILASNPLLNEFSEFSHLASVGGELKIYDCGITSMNGLENLRSAGRLSVFSNDSLVNFNGLDQLEYVGQLTVSGKEIENLEPLTSLLHIGGLEIAGCPKLQHLPVLDKVNFIDGFVTILENNLLKDLRGLDSIHDVNGHLSIWFCRSLTTLHGLENLNQCSDGFYIASNDSLINLNALNHLTRINGTLRLVDNSSLIDIEGIRNLLPGSIHPANGSTSPYSIEIFKNPRLSNCAIESVCAVLSERIAQVIIDDNAEECKSPVQVLVNCPSSHSCQEGGLIITKQDQIDSFNINTPGCSFILGNVLIQEEVPGNITNLQGLKGIKTIGGSLTVANNSALDQLNGLDSLTLIGGVIKISNNDHLFSIGALENIDPDYINTASFEENHFIITDNDNLSVCSIQPLCDLLVIPNVKVDIHGNSEGCADRKEAIDGCGFPTECTLSSVRDQTTIDEFPIRYPKCTELTGGLSLFRAMYETASDPILTLAPLSQLTTLNGGLTVRNINDLVDLSGLENLRNINGPIEISNNPSLQTLESIKEINPSSVLGSVAIYDNVSLADCAVESICKVLEQNEINISIARNATDCNNEYEVKALCIVPVENIPDPEQIKIYPNPTTGMLQIDLKPGMDTEFTLIEIYDLSGRKLRSFGFEPSVSISSLERGLYIMVIYDQNQPQYYSRILLTD